MEVSINNNKPIRVQNNIVSNLDVVVNTERPIRVYKEEE